MMMNFFSVFSSKAVQPQSARPSENPRNWRCQLGTFWQDIEEAGSVLKARRLVPSESASSGRAGSTASPDGTATDKARTTLRSVLEFAENPETVCGTDPATRVMSSE